METLLREMSHGQLAGLFRRHEDRSSVPHLRDSKAIVRARQLAKKNGIWDSLQDLDPTLEIPVVKRSAYRNYKRVGDRSVPQAASGRRSSELGRAAMAVWLDHPKAHVDYLQDLLWAACDEWTWVMAAHEGLAIDLGSAGRAVTFAELLYALDDKLEDEVKDRVKTEIDRRIFRNFWDYEAPDWWKTCEHNWNHVCNGCIIRAALLLIDNPNVLAHMVHGAIINMTYAIDGFTDDGGCVEGPGYWNYGFGNYLEAAYALYVKTDGELNLMEDEKIERISRYPLAAQISGPLRSTFADSGHGYTGALPALLINQFYEMPELLGTCQLHPDQTLRVHGMHELALYDGRKVKATSDQKDYLLPDLGQVKLRGKSGMTLMAIAGNNGVNHNHNDIGSFLLHQGDRLHLVDPGGPVYSAKTFSSKRYEIVYCNSFGHSVPVINGNLQSPGGKFFGALSVENLNGEGEKRAVIDMTHAYPAGTVKELVRTFVLNADANRLRLEDAYVFSRAPKSVEEAFITFEKATVAKDGQSVQIGAKTSGLRLTANMPGKFSVARLVEESKEGRSDQVITRISFVPKKLEKEMALVFEMG